MAIEEPRRSPRNQTRSPRPNDNGGENILSPRFRSIAAMAGWDEETLLMASFIVDDTPDRERKNRKHQNSKTPPSNSRRKRKHQGAKHSPIPATILKLDDDDEEDTPRNKEKKTETQNGKEESKTVNVSAASLIPCMDKLREELSCAICLDICFEPSTTPCGHSFCKKCLKSAADKCGKRCPKCRQLIGNGRSCTVNTVLWNTIQLLFPNEIEARKVHSSAEKQPNRQDRDRITYSSNSHSQTRPQPTAIARRRRNRDSSRTQSSVPSQDEDAALALRLQREEFLQVVRVERGSSSTSNGDNSRISISLARENLRAMASRAINVRIRNRAT